MSARASSRPAGAAPGLPGRVVRAAAALVALAALLVGVPVVLVRLETWPISGVPTGDQLRDLPSTIVTDDAVLGVLTVALWGLWALFVVSVLLEVVALRRGRRGGRHAGHGRSFGGPVQAMARWLVGSLMMSAGSVVGAGHVQLAGASPAVAIEAAAPVGHAASWTPGTDDGGGIGSLAGPAPPSPAGAAVPGLGSHVTVTVGRGDTAWSLAEIHLGDGARWRALWEVNRDRPQPDGRAWHDADEPVRAGWSLRLPVDVPRGVDAAPVAVRPEDGPPAGRPSGPASVGGPMQRLTGSGGAVPSEVTVRPGDNFWDLAEAQLTQAWGRRPTDAEVIRHWRALVGANRDALSPPGDPDLIHPGEVFTVPTPPPDPSLARGLSAPAVGEPADPGAPEPDCDPVDEQAPAETPGDTQAPAGEAPGGTQAPAGEPAGEEAPPPGQASGDGPVAPGAAPADGPPPVGQASGDGPPPAGAAPGGEQADGRDPAVPGAGPGADPGPPAPGGGATPPGPGASVPGGDPGPAGGDAEAGGRVPVGLVGGGVALAGALLVLERRRRARLRHRGRGGVVALPAEDERVAEEQLRWGADIDGARLLDVALRAAAAGAGATGLPRLAWAETGPDGALLALAHPAPAPPGFVPLDGQRWATTARADDLAAMATHAAPPAPALVPLGRTDQGAELLVDLETSGVVTVEGPAPEVTGLLRSIVTALSTAIWNDQPRVVPVGLDPTLDRLPGVTSAPSLSDALALAEAHAAATAAALRSLRCPSVGQARAVGATPEAWDPLVVVSAVPPGDRSEHRRLVDLADRGDTAVALVVVPSIDTGASGRRFAIGDHGWLLVDDVPEPVAPRRLDPGDVARLVELLAPSAEPREAAPDDPSIVALAPRRPPVVEPGSRTGTGDTGGTRGTGDTGDTGGTRGTGDTGGTRGTGDTGGTRGTGDAGAGAGPGEPGHGEGRPAPAGASPRPDRLGELLSDVEVVVRVLGEVSAVRVTAPGGRGERLVPTRQRALEAVAYLALRESAVDREDLEISLFPDGANAAKTVYNTVSSARALLGEELFPPPEAGRYEVSPAVVTDYGIFCELAAEADETDDALLAADLLHQALSLVHGEPFTGVGRSYAWVGPHRGMIVAQVVDAAEELAEVRLASGDWRGAEWAARQGLRAFPSDERMYRLLMRTARAAGNIPGVQRVFRELCDVLADPDLGVEPEDTVHPETVELLEKLTGTRPREGRLGA